VRLVFFDDYNLGVITKQGVVDISGVIGAPGLHPQQQIEDLISRWKEYKPLITNFTSNRAALDPNQVRFRAPLPRPSKILCAVANYMEGIEGNISDLEFFHKSPSAIIGDGDTIVLPNVEASIFHHELELAVVIGSTCTNVSEEEAMNHVFGYMIFQDGSARGILSNGKISFFTQKNWDTFAPMGPMIVTADEVDDPHDLQVRLWANGELRQDYNTSDMAHRIPTLISKASFYNTLQPGDIIATGCNRQGLGPMQHGDRIIQEITGLGKLTTLVSDPLERRWPYGIDVEFANFVTKPRSERTAPGLPRVVPAASVRRQPA
jgi:2-keto-4-pentenoate hydratase/2-oxohepta-3-ene-1,7-dioic acid hydratase in catechol pathway